MKKFRTQWNDVQGNRSHEKKSMLPSMTVPDQTLPLKEIVDRFTKGIRVEAAVRTPVYHGDVYVPDVERMDLVDKHNLLEAAKQQTQQIQKTLRKQEKEKANKPEKPLEIEKPLEEKPKDPPDPNKPEAKPGQ